MCFDFFRVLACGVLFCFRQRRVVWCIVSLSVFFVAIPDVAQSGVIAFYTFSGNAMDVSGSGLHGTVSGASLTADRFGVQDSAYLFDDIDDSIVVQNVGGLLSLSGPFSLTAWVRPDGPSFDQRNNPILWKLAGPGDPDNYFLAWHSGNRFSSGLEDSVTDLDLGVSSSSHAPGVWYHVAAVYDRQAYKIFVNGVLEGVVAVNNITPYTGSYPLRIGNILGSSHGNAGVFNGAIDEIGVFEHALSSTEIAMLYGGPQVVPEPASLAILMIGLCFWSVARVYRNRWGGVIPARDLLRGFEA